MSLPKKTAALKVRLDAMPGAEAVPVPAPGGRPPPALMYKIMGKIFAILSVRGDAFVILKCDPELAGALRAKYAGVGHRSHLDRRFWISIDLDGDVPGAEIRRLVAHSYDQVAASLPRKRREALAALSS